MTPEAILEQIAALPVNLTSVIKRAEIVCPACETAYVEGEFRSHAATCCACRGFASNAKEADDAVQELADGFEARNVPTEILTRFVGNLGAGFWRSEFRAALKRRIGQ